MIAPLHKFPLLPLQALACLLLACAFPGCSADPVTELVVVVNSDMAVPDEFDGFRVVIKGNDGDVATDRYFFIGKEPGKVLLPADFGLIPKGGDASRRVNVEIFAQASGADLFSTRAITGFVEGKTLRLDMFLAGRCLSEAKACKPNETCRSNGCQPAEIDPGSLPEFDGNTTQAGPDWLHAAKSSGAIWWDTAVDEAGNVYAAGVYTSGIVVNGTSYPVTGGSTAMIASFDSTGAIRWFKSLPASTMSWVHSIAATAAGRVCVSGWFAGQMQAGAELLDSGAGQNGILECYDANGALQLVKSFGGAGNVQPKDVAIAPNGDIGVGGLYFRTMTLGGDTLPETATDDAFIARFDASGNPKYARAFGGNGEDDVAWAVAFDSQSNMIAGGTVSSGTMDFGGTPGTFAAPKNAYVAKYQPDGSLAWVRTFENGGGQMLSAVDVGPQDQVVIAGGFPGTIDFGGGPLTSAGDLDNAVVVLDSSGKHVASKLFGGSGTDRAQAVRFRAGKVVMAGLHKGPMTFGTTSVLSGSDQNGYVLALSPDLATLQWAHSLGGAGDDTAHGVEFSASAVMVAGEFAKTLAFGQLSATSAGASDGFLLYFRP